MKVAICLCTYKRQALLSGLLSFLDRACELPPETILIVADNECNPEIAKIVTQHFPDAHYLQVPKRGVAEARNATINHALTLDVDALAFIDDDDLPHPTWLQTLLAYQMRNNAALVYGAAYRHGEPRPKVVRGTCNCLVMRWAVEKLSPPYFNELTNFIGGEDALFFNRLEEVFGQGTRAPLSVVLRNRDKQRDTYFRRAQKAFSEGFRGAYIARRLGTYNKRSLNEWVRHECWKLFKSIIKLPFKFWNRRDRQKFTRSLYGALGALFGLCGGKHEYYRDRSTR